MTKKDNPVETAEKTDNKPEKAKASLAGDIGYLLLKIILIGLIIVILFTFMFGITRCNDGDMEPAIKEGDLVIYYRLQKNYQFGDAIVVSQDGKKQIRRVVAVAGDKVDITDKGLEINGFGQQESNIYKDTLPYKEGIDFPVTVGEGQVFVLGDERTNAKDSRIYGPVDVKSTGGRVMMILRQRNI